MSGITRLLRLASIIRKYGVLTCHEISREFSPPKVPVNPDAKVTLHLGCGRIVTPGSINIDLVPFRHVHFIREVSDLSIFPRSYADSIYASHILEHISHRDTVKVLKEWHRVLKPGGVLRLSVPDFDKIVDVYRKKGENLRALIGALMGGQDDINNFHKALFNQKELESSLLSAGFKSVRRWDSSLAHDCNIKDWSNTPIMVGCREFYISLNVEAEA